MFLTKKHGAAAGAKTAEQVAATYAATDIPRGEFLNEIARLCARLFRIALGDVENPVENSEFSDLAEELTHCLFAGSGPASQQAALERLKGLCRDYDIE